MRCLVHENEPIRYICRTTHRLLCCKCILMPEHSVRNDELIFFRKRDSQPLARLLRKKWAEKCRSVEATLDCLEHQVAQDNDEVVENITRMAELIPFHQMTLLGTGQAEMLQALTGKSFVLKAAQLKLQNSKCLQIIMQFIDTKRAMELQLISRKFYRDHVPFAFPVVPYVPIRSKFLVRDHINLMKSCFDYKVKFELLYVGRDHGFSSLKFH